MNPALHVQLEILSLPALESEFDPQSVQAFTLISSLYVPVSQFSQNPKVELPIKVFPGGHEVIRQTPSALVNPELHVQLELPALESEFKPQSVHVFVLVSSLYLPRSQSSQNPDTASPFKVCPN